MAPNFRNNGQRTGKPTPEGRRFQPGNPGRPKGARNKVTIAIATLLDGEHEALTRKAIELAKDGDIQALRLCLERLFPPRKDSPVSFALPSMRAATDAVPAMAALVRAVAIGDLTPLEAGELTKIVQAFAKIIEITELDQRIRKLEEAAR